MGRFYSQLKKCLSDNVTYKFGINNLQSYFNKNIFWVLGMLLLELL